MESTTQNVEKGIEPQVLIFIILTGILTSIGFGIITPVAPFLISRYVSDPNQAGIVLGWLTSIFAICQFLSAPALGALSDKYGRRAILLLCILGSAIGFLLLGLGGALWVLFLGRIIDGITGANMSVTFAFIADVTPPGQRGKFFGMMGAIMGIGFLVGPAVGGVLARFGVVIPFYAAAALTFVNVLYGFFFMPESLPKEKRSQLKMAALNPFSALANVLSIPPLRWLLVAIFLYTVPFAALSVNISLLAKDNLHWDAAGIGVIFASVGITDILVQGLLLQVLMHNFGESAVAIGGLILEIVGYILMASVVLVLSPIPMMVGTIVLAMGDGLLGPSLNGLLSGAAGAEAQGQVQGGNQSMQSLARIIGPFVGGLMYVNMGHASPFLSGVFITLLAIAAIMVARPKVNRFAPLNEQSAPPNLV
ncbi:MAG: MFS transporter [Chloroflexi bacterium]|nr:MFS transporter [Chloroflexota bacterium]